MSAPTCHPPQGVAIGDTRSACFVSSSPLHACVGTAAEAHMDGPTGADLNRVHHLFRLVEINRQHSTRFWVPAANASPYLTPRKEQQPGWWKYIKAHRSKLDQLVHKYSHSQSIIHGIYTHNTFEYYTPLAVHVPNLYLPSL